MKRPLSHLYAGTLNILCKLQAEGYHGPDAQPMGAVINQDGMERKVPVPHVRQAAARRPKLELY